MKKNRTLNKPISQEVKLKERLSYALTNSGQTMVYALFTTYLMIYLTDYLYIGAGVAGVILGVTRVFDAINDSFMGAILDKTKTRFGKCRPYMLFTPIPLAIVTLIIFAPFNLSNTAAVIYIAVFYVIFTMIYTANDIPFWSMSSVITTDPNQRVKIVTMTRLIGGLGSGVTIGTFWLVNKLAADSGFDRRTSIFLTVLVFVVLGTILMLQGFFNTKERAKNTVTGNEKLFENLKHIPKSKPLVINLIAGMLMSVMMVGATAMTTYFVKWNMKDVFPDLESNDLLSILTPVIGILPAIAMGAGLLAAPFLIKRFEKRNVLIIGCIWGIVANVIFYFVGYQNIYIFIIGRFLSFLPVGIWSSITTIMFGDSVDDLQYKTGKRLEGTCFSLLTFIGKFQNAANVAISGFILSAAGYIGTLDPNVAQQSSLTLNVIFVMVTLVPALGFLLMGTPFLFYDFTKSKHQAILDALEQQNALSKQQETIIESVNE